MNKRSLVRSLLITAALLSVYLGIGWYLIQLEERRWLSMRGEELHAELSNQASQIERQLSRALVAAESMESYIRHHNGAIEDFDTHSADLIRNVGVISVLELAPGGIVSHLFPLAGHQELLGRDIAHDGPGAIEARLAIVTREPTLSAPFEMSDGTRAIVGRVPVYIQDDSAMPAVPAASAGADDHAPGAAHDHGAPAAGGHLRTSGSEAERYWGMASVIIKVDDLLRETQLLRLNERGLRYRITGATEGEPPQLIAGSPAPLESEHRVAERIRIARGGVELQVEPREGWERSPMFLLHVGVFASLGAFLSVFIFSLVWLPERLRAQIASASEALRIANQRYTTVFNSVREVIFQIDESRRWEMLNPAWEDVTGVPVSAAIGRPAELYFHPEDLVLFQTLLNEAMAGKSVGSAELRLRGNDEAARWVEMNLRGGERIDGLTGTLRDITERKRSDRLIRYQANYDTLTNLPNRKLFRDRFSQAIEQTQRNHRRLALMFVDLDRFKWVNDTLGHAAGDRLLKEVAKRLRACVRKVDTVGRFGGDEFVMLVAEIAEAVDAEIVARKVLEELSRPFDLGESVEQITCSIGITICPDDGSDITTLLSNADNVMYHAKESGRNTFKFYTEEMNRALHDRRRKEEALRTAIDSHGLSLYFQPIYRIRDRLPVGVEALLRWESPEFGNTPTRELIALAENTRMIDTLGEWVLRESVRQFRQLRDMGLPLQYVNVNMSPRQFRGRGLEQVRELVEAGLVEPGELAIDITEELVAIDQQSIWDGLDALKQLGVRLNLDDFGSGLSSLAHLNRLAPESIKISGDYLNGTLPEAGTAAMVGSIISLAHSMGITVISEGVENERQAEMMEVLGCDFEQGHRLCRPLPADALREHLAKA